MKSWSPNPERHIRETSFIIVLSALKSIHFVFSPSDFAHSDFDDDDDNDDMMMI